MPTNPDFRQQAALKCLATGKLNAANPYSGPYYQRAYRSVVQDAARRKASQERRVATFFDSSGTRERYDADVRYQSDGDDSDDPSKRLAAREEQRILMQSMARVASDDTELVRAHDLQNRRTSELASEHRTSESAIRARLLRERQRIKKELEASGVTR